MARATTQAMLVLENAGYDVVLVETVGVGQSEMTVAGMVDTFLFLTLARTGDQLQGIKKGILEIADVHRGEQGGRRGRATGPGGALRGPRARRRAAAGAPLGGAAAAGCRRSSPAPGSRAPGCPRSGRRCSRHRDHLGADGLAAQRAEQQLEFTWALVRDELAQRLRRSPGVRAVRDEVRAAVLAGELPASVAADRILAAYDADRASAGGAT